MRRAASVSQAPTLTRSAFCFSLSQHQRRRKARWWKEARFASTARAKRYANLGLSTPASSCRRWTADFSRRSIWRCRREQSWPRLWGSRRPRWGRVLCGRDLFCLSLHLFTLVAQKNRNCTFVLGSILIQWQKWTFTPQACIRTGSFVWWVWRSLCTCTFIPCSSLFLVPQDMCLFCFVFFYLQRKDWCKHLLLFTHGFSES